MRRFQHVSAARYQPIAASAALRASSSSSSSSNPFPMPSTPYDRDAIDLCEGFAPETGYCGRFATVARQPQSNGDEAAGSSSSKDEGGGGGGSSNSMRYRAEPGTLLARTCALGNALEQDLRRIRYDLMDRQQIRFVKVADAKASTATTSKSTASSTSMRNVTPAGTASVLAKPFVLATRVLLSKNKKDKNSNAFDHALALSEDAPDRHVPYLNQRQLNYYLRTYLVPKRNIFFALYHVGWNAAIAVTNASIAVFAIPLHYALMGPSPTRDMVMPPPPTAAAGVARKVAHSMATSHSMPARFAYGCYRAARAVALYGAVGAIVSPVVHIPQSIINNYIGLKNGFGRPLYSFDAADGVWIRQSVPDCDGLKKEMIERMQRMLAVGRREAYARKIASEVKWKDYIGKLGMAKGGGASGSSLSDDPYEVLNVPRDATQQQIKSAYQKLAKIYHPDVNVGLPDKEKEKLRAKFDQVATSYKLLSTPETRRMYDRGGKRAVEQQQGAVLMGSSGDVMERVFGGIYFRETLSGMHFRSHWHMKFQFQCCISIAELEEVQSLQVRLVASKLAAILDVHAKDAAIGPFIYLGTSPRHTAENLMKQSLAADAAAKTAAADAAAAASAGGKEKDKPYVRPAAPNPFAKKSPTSSSVSKKSGGGGKATESAAESQVKAAAAETNNTASTPQPAASPAASTTDPLIFVMSSLPPSDAEFSLQFRQRTAKYISKLATACFGREMLHEIGLSLITTAKAYLGAEGTSYYAPKNLQRKKNWAGIWRVFKEFKKQVHDLSKEEMQQMAALQFFAMEWDNVALDTHVQMRFVAQLVAWSVDGEAEISALPPQIAAEKAVPTTPTGIKCSTLQYKRLRAMWYVGLQMQKEGCVWDSPDRQCDRDLIAYFQRSAKGGMDTPPVF